MAQAIAIVTWGARTRALQRALKGPRPRSRFSHLGRRAGAAPGELLVVTNTRAAVSSIRARDG